MSAGPVIAIVLAALVAGLAAGYWLPLHRRVIARRDSARPVRRILVPFTGTFIPRRAFEAAIRLAKAENAVIMPAFLARVPMNLPLASPLPKQCAEGMPLLEVIEQRALAQGVEVDSRVSRGRTARDALRALLDEEPYDRIIVSEDLQWLLDNVPAEVMILRPAKEDNRRIAAGAAEPPGI